VSAYYSDKLSATRLKQAYETAPARVRQYLDAEVTHVMEKIRPGDLVVELGCGYGRIIPRLAAKAGWVVGIDTSVASLEYAQETFDISNCSFSRMNAVKLGFCDGVFDCVVCIQNGISAFHVDQQALIIESARVAKAGATVLFSSYSERFWENRLEWFELQSKAGLVGEIDYEKTRDGVIVCKDGFTATTVSSDHFLALTAQLHADVRIVEVDESSLFCEIARDPQSSSALHPQVKETPQTK
jgi:2-polyprenyl-6-hydroxyphenyl methylase/3-demethylubiquinone-9 3-methyltransferase